MEVREPREYGSLVLYFPENGRQCIFGLTNSRVTHSESGLFNPKFYGVHSLWHAISISQEELKKELGKAAIERVHKNKGLDEILGLNYGVTHPDDLAFYLFIRNLPQLSLEYHPEKRLRDRGMAANLSPRKPIDLREAYVTALSLLRDKAVTA
jgi:hypothetical protein